MSEPNQSLKLELYKMVAQTRNLEISLFWQRSNYFLVLNTAIAAGFFSLKDQSYTLLLSLTGIAVAGLWVAVNLGSKFWQSRWEYRLNQTEKDLGADIDLFSAKWETVQQDVKRSFEFRRRGPIHRLYQWSVMLKPSVTMMMTLLSVTFVVFWILALAIHVVARSSQPEHAPESPIRAESSGDITGGDPLMLDVIRREQSDGATVWF